MLGARFSTEDTCSNTAMMRKVNFGLNLKCHYVQYKLNVIGLVHKMKVGVCQIHTCRLACVGDRVLMYVNNYL